MDSSKKLVSIAIVVLLIAVACVLFIPHNDKQPTGDHTITDMQGNEVILPYDIDRVAITSQTPMVPAFIYYMNGTDKLVGANSAGLTYARSGIMSKVYNLNGIESSFVTGSVVNIEALQVLDPDAVIYTGNRTDEHTLLDNAKIANVGFNTAMTGGNSTDPFETMECWMDLMKEMFGDNGRGDALVEYNDYAKRTVSNKISGLSDSDKPTAMIIFAINESAGTVKVACDGQYSECWLKSAGAVNVAAGSTGLKDVTMEQIISWNPDYIFFAKGDGKMPSDLVDNTISGQDWSSITAVKNNNVYVFPSATYFSYAPSLEAGVTLQFLAKVMHPELFADMDLKSVASDFFKKLFNYNATAQEIEDFLYPDEISVRLH